MRESTVIIANVRPALLGTYGDGGNAMVLRERLRRRGHDAEVLQLDGHASIPAGSDLITFGGGEDDAQVIAARDEALGASLRSAIEAGAVVFAVCAGFQLLGETFEVGPGTEVAGFGVLVYLTVLKLDGHAIGQRPLLFLGVLLVVVGLQFFSLGLISELITSQHEERAGPRERTELHVDEILS